MAIPWNARISDCQAAERFDDATREQWQAHVGRFPDDARGWRLLGRAHLSAGQEQLGFEALQSAVELAPNDVEANFDIGHVLFVAGRTSMAEPYLWKVVQLAPQSRQAARALDDLQQIIPDHDPNEMSDILLAGYDVQSFDGSDRPEPLTRLPMRQQPTDDPFDVFVESGLLYNSNVALTPISRSLAPGTRESFQAFVAPEFEYRLWNGASWESGPTFDGYFNLNEGNFRQFNLQNYQPGWYVELERDYERFTLQPRVEYDFTHDEFDGRTFGNRHALTTSALMLWNDGDSTFAYWSINYTDFASDGALPQFDSRDGWTNNVGLSHTIETGMSYLDFCRGGVDLEVADTDGRDFRYRGIYLYGETESELRKDLWLDLELGWGYRDYPDFTLDPSRNESIWRAGAELSQKLTQNWTLALVFNYNLFDSKNAFFEAERYVGGIVLRYQN